MLEMLLVSHFFEVSFEDLELFNATLISGLLCGCKFALKSKLAILCLVEFLYLFVDIFLLGVIPTFK